MKPIYTSSFARGQKTVRWLLALAIISGLAGYILLPEQSTPQLLVFLLSLGLLVSIPVVASRSCRCPYCGKSIVAGVLVVSTCPNCKRNLYTGDKVKKAKAKKK